MTATGLDARVLDLLADEKVVAEIETVLECAREVQSAYSGLSVGPVKRSSWGSPREDAGRDRRSRVHQANTRRNEALEALMHRLIRLSEDVARDERATAEGVA